MKVLYIATLSFVLLISACSDAPDSQSQAQSEPQATEAVAETSKPTPAAESKPPQLAYTSKQPAPIVNKPTVTLADVVPKSDPNSENCTVDPVTGRVVCTTGLCALFNDLCPPGTPMGMAKIPFDIGYNIATTVATSAVTVAKTGLETTDIGTVIVEKISAIAYKVTGVTGKLTNALYKAKRAISEMLSDPAEGFDTIKFDPIKKTNDYSTQAINKPKVTYQETN